MTPNPGSDEALAAGCNCPVMDNAHGKGYMGIENVFVMRVDCLIHSKQAQKIMEEKQ